MTDSQAKRAVEWITSHGHTEAEAYEALAHIMKAKIEDKEKEAPDTSK